MAIFAMPSLGADMDAGKLVEWLVGPGDTVKRGDVVAVVETQKGAIEIEIFLDGVVERLEAELGATLPVGAPLATIRVKGEAIAADDAQPKAVVAEPKLAPPEQPVPPEQPAPAKVSDMPPVVRSMPAATPGVPAPSSPAARVLAAERGIDLSTLRGSGPMGAILLTDVQGTTVLSATSAKAEAPAPARKPGFDAQAMRVAIAAAMTRSKREIPHYYLSQTIDLQPATDWLAATNATRVPDKRLLMGALFVKAATLAATAVPELNGQYGEAGFRPSAGVHAGVAVALRGGGLIAPAIRDAETLNLDQTMTAMRDLVARARSGRLRSSEITDGTITISSMGETGADQLTAVIYPPQVAIVGVGAPVVRPWVIDGEILPRTLVTVTLSADHRVSDGRRGARFLAEINRVLQNPEAL
jgi:pyruvate dehydrogenase E2 component (dihydrolipoamide acetyltransferase)